MTRCQTVFVLTADLSANQDSEQEVEVVGEDSRQTNDAEILVLDLRHDA